MKFGLKKRGVVRLIVTLVAVYAMVWGISFAVLQGVASEYRNAREIEDSAVYLVVYTQFHLKSLTAQQRAAIENPNPPVAPEPVKPPSGAAPFVWSLVADCVSVSHRTSALYEYADDAMVGASYAMRDVTPYQYRI